MITDFLVNGDHFLTTGWNGIFLAFLVLGIILALLVRIYTGSGLIAVCVLTPLVPTVSLLLDRGLAATIGLPALLLYFILVIVVIYRRVISAGQMDTDELTSPKRGGA